MSEAYEPKAGAFMLIQVHVTASSRFVKRALFALVVRLHDEQLQTTTSASPPASHACLSARNPDYLGVSSFAPLRGLSHAFVVSPLLICIIFVSFAEE